jgi:hypothetical protein
VIEVVIPPVVAEGPPEGRTQVVEASSMALIPCEVTEGPRPGFKVVGVGSIEGHTEYLTIEERFLVAEGMIIC